MELRGIEDHIAQLHSEIENMKPQTDAQKKTNFDVITKLAAQNPINGIGITKAPELLQKEFVNSLSYLLLREDNDRYSRILYLSRLAMGCKLELSAEDIYQSGLAFESKDIEQVSAALQPYKYSYLIEAFIIANLSKDASVTMLTVIADMAMIMGCDKEEIRVLAQIAKSRLVGDLEVLKSIPIPSESRWCGKFDDYISKDWIVSQRKKCITICTGINVKKNSMDDGIGQSVKTVTSSMEKLLGDSLEKESEIKNYDTKFPCTIKQMLQSGTPVKKEDTILVYEEEVTKQHEINLSWWINMETVQETRTITAPTDGIVFFVEIEKNGKVSECKDKYLAVYVVSFFDEYNDFCQWYANKK